MTMAVENTFVSDARAKVSALLTAFDEALTVAQHYDSLTPTWFASYWAQQGLDISQSDFEAALAAIKAIKASADSSGFTAPLLKVRG